MTVCTGGGKHTRPSHPTGGEPKGLNRGTLTKKLEAAGQGGVQV